jgi:uncharacterized protein (DUF488 family)
MIFTIGHSNVPAERLVELLQQHEIATVLDVRSTPYSRYNPQYNRETIQRTLEKAGIAYAYAGDYLGGRPDDPACYENGEVSYRLVAARPWFRRALARLIELAGEERTAIMCAEENPNRCHRHHLVTRALLREGETVWHIRGDGRLEEANPELPQAEQLPLL